MQASKLKAQMQTWTCFSFVTVCRAKSCKSKCLSTPGKNLTTVVFLRNSN